MYRLYVNKGNGWEEMSRSKYEKDIVDKLDYEFRYNGGMYGIIRDIGNGDEAYKFIRSEQDLNDYLQYYRHKMLMEMSVLDLKREILDIKEGKKKK